MNRPILKSGIALALSLTIGAASGCQDEDRALNSSNPFEKRVKIEDQSVTPALIKTVDITGLDIASWISSDDTLSDSPNFIFGGSADGMGILVNPDKSYTMVVNHEDNFSVSRVTLDKKFRPEKGEYIVNSDGGRWRLCSATLATPEEHGFGPTYLTCGESGQESMIHAIDPKGTSGQSNPKAALGHWSAENAVPLPKTAYSTKTVILIGDDDSDAYGGQVAMYVGNTGDLNNGDLYVLARTNNDTKEMNMVPGQTYNVTFRKIPNQTTMTGAQINAKTADLSAVRFGRVEDIDYRKGGSAHGREIYFNVTGQNNTGVNADYSRTKYGRMYRLTLNANDPTQGTLEVILDGDDRNGIARKFQNPDNICVTQNYVYIQEDPNGYGDETHDAYLYQYNIATGQLRVALELDHHRGDSKYNVGGDSKFGTWEYGAMIDVSDLVDIDDVFAICIQPHTWTGARYKNPDGGTVRPNESQASQIILVKGLDR